MSAWLALLVAAGAGQVPVEPLRQAVAAAYARRGEPLPEWDPSLARVAEQAAAARAEGLDSPERLGRRVREAGLGDPAPEGFLVEGPEPALVARALADRLPPFPGANAVGVGGARTPAGQVRAVVVRVQRKAWIFAPREVAPGGTLVLRGRLAPGLSRPALDVEGPDGRVAALPLRTDGPAVEGRVILRAPGRYVVEVMADGGRGPEVVWLYGVVAGSGGGEAAPRPVATAGGVAPERAVFEAINRLRLASGEPALAFDERLVAIARAYAEEMASLGILAHVSPRSGGLVARLARAGYGYARAGENLARGPDPMEAHRLAAGSPAHRRNMLDPTFDRCGVGVAAAVDPTGQRSFVVTELFAGG